MGNAQDKLDWESAKQAALMYKEAYRKGSLIIEHNGHFEGLDYVLFESVFQDYNFFGKADTLVPLLENPSEKFYTIRCEKDCSKCGKRLIWETNGQIIRVLTYVSTPDMKLTRLNIPCEYAEVKEITATINVPSGKLVFHNTLHDDSFITDEEVFNGEQHYLDYNSVSGLNHMAQSYAKHNIGWGFMNARMMTICTSEDGKIHVVEPECGDDNDVYPDNMTDHGHIDNTVRCFTCADYGMLKKLNSERLEYKLKHDSVIIDVEPGVYKITNRFHLLGADDKAPYIFATIEKVE